MAGPAGTRDCLAPAAGSASFTETLARSPALSFTQTAFHSHFAAFLSASNEDHGLGMIRHFCLRPGGAWTAPHHHPWGVCLLLLCWPGAGEEAEACDSSPRSEGQVVVPGPSGPLGGPHLSPGVAHSASSTQLCMCHMSSRGCEAIQGDHITCER